MGKDLVHLPGRRDRARLRRIAGAVAVATVLAGCGFVNTGDDSEEGGGPGTLTVMVNTEQQTGLQSLYTEFQKSSGTTIDASAAATDELNQRLRVQLTSGTAADVIRVSPGFSSPVAVGVLGADQQLADVSAASWTSSLSPDTRKLAESDGKVLAFPVGRNAIVMAYNTKVFAAAGVRVPTTWSELLKACDALKAAGKTPIANPLQGGVYLQFWMYALAATLVYAENPDIDAEMAAGKTSFVKDKGWNDVFAKFLQLRDAGYFTDGALGVPADQGLQAVASGTAGMVLTVTPAVPQLAKYAKGGAADIGIFALPATDAAGDTRVPVAPDFLAVNAAAKNADAARSFLDFLAKPENVAAYANTMGVLPGLDVDAKVTSKALDPIRPLIDGGRTAAYANYLWPNGDVQQTLLQSGQELYSKKITTTQLLTKMDADYAKGTP